jgi:hypothetical protein
MSTLSSHCRESPELLLSQPTLATTHSELTSLEELIISNIQVFIDQENKSYIRDDFRTLTEQLPGFCNSVLGFVETVLTIYSYYNNIAH